MNRRLSAAVLSLCLASALPLTAHSEAASATVVKIDKPAAGTTILIATPQTSMSLLTTSGPDPKEEWNTNARKGIAAGLADAVKARGYAPEAVDPAAYEGSRDLQMLKLNDTVTAAIQTNAFIPLPTKTTFDWTLGEGAADLRPEGEASPAAYILFVHASGNYSSGGRVMMGALLAVASGGNAGGAMMVGGSQTISGTLVDLNTGKIVWYRQAGFASTTDLRTEEGEKSAVAVLLKDLPL